MNGFEEWMYIAKWGLLPTALVGGVAIDLVMGVVNTIDIAFDKAATLFSQVQKKKPEDQLPFNFSFTLHLWNIVSSDKKDPKDLILLFAITRVTLILAAPVLITYHAPDICFMVYPCLFHATNAFSVIILLNGITDFFQKTPKSITPYTEPDSHDPEYDANALHA